MTLPVEWLEATLKAELNPTTYVIVVKAITAVSRNPSGTFDIGDLRELPISTNSRKRGIRALREKGFLDITPTFDEIGKSGRSIYRLKIPNN